MKHIIETKFVRLRKNVIERHRRVRTPFFYFNLSIFEYHYLDEQVNYVYGCRVPARLNIRYERWVSSDLKPVLNKELISELEKANKRITNNVLYLSSSG